MKEIRLLDFAASDAHVAGTVQGSPVVIGTNIFAGVEHPMADNRVKDGRVTGSLFRKVPIGARRDFTVSSVVGVTAPGQLRREFQLGYVNRERARPYAPYLNYNTWYDIGYFTRYDGKMAAEVVKTYGEEMVKKRGVKFDSFLFDDGWDDTATLWKFNKGFPNEFKDVAKLAESYGASPGVWFSPWGGYGAPKDQRIRAAKEKTPAVETNKTGFALSGNNYYKVFRDMCVHMIKENGIRHFKFDGTGDAGSVQPGSKFGSDFEAVIALIAELRAVQPDLYVNLTTGTWASPFWFGTADSIWRGGYDHEFLGAGTKRNQWVTYRDGMTYRYNVAPAPLFPINSLMLHGVLYAKGARDLQTDPANDLPGEIWSGRRRHADGGTLHHALAAHAGELGRTRQGRQVGEGQCRHARRHALDRRRPRETGNLRLGLLVVGKGHPRPAQPVGPGAGFLRRSGRALRAPARRRHALHAGLAERRRAPRRRHADRRQDHDLRAETFRGDRARGVAGEVRPGAIRRIRPDLRAAVGALLATPAGTRKNQGRIASP